jgi:hypothetical protein
MTLGRRRPRPWTPAQLQQRIRDLRADGFTPEEAFDLALWSHPLNHWVIENMRRDRRTLLINLQGQGLGLDDITERLERRYLDLGIEGQYENEEWYVSRVSA